MALPDNFYRLVQSFNLKYFFFFFFQFCYKDNYELFFLDKLI